jgi:hypothetical protein
MRNQILIIIYLLSFNCFSQTTISKGNVDNVAKYDLEGYDGSWHYTKTSSTAKISIDKSGNIQEFDRTSPLPHNIEWVILHDNFLKQGIIVQSPFNIYYFNQVTTFDSKDGRFTYLVYTGKQKDTNDKVQIFHCFEKKDLETSIMDGLPTKDHAILLYNWTKKTCLTAEF